MSEPSTVVLCRDCLARPARASARCLKCGSPRLVRHAELFSLAVAHVDCGAFYAAVEKRDDPSLADKPVIVGGGRRGVVAAACCVARTYGVRSAMPMFKSHEACQHAAVIAPDMAKYASVARRVRQLMQSLTPAVEPLSIDEAFLDLSGTERLHGAPPAVMLAGFQQRLEREIGITASVGLSHNKFLAKIASDLDKPRGFAVIGPAETVSSLAEEPVSLIWGVGAVMQKRLARDGIRRSLKARLVVLKLKSGDFRLRTRNAQLDSRSNLADRIFQAGRALLFRELDGTRFRLIGIGVAEIGSADLAETPGLRDPDAAKRARAEAAMGEVRARFGPRGVALGLTFVTRPVSKDYGAGT